ncbi:MAG: histidine phosphatase family protein [Candidatus Aquirickettsiella sp.]
MKNLTLIRHAETNPQQIFESDKDRILTQRGLHQIENIAKQLKEKKCIPDFLLCSSARRAIQTAQLLCEKLEINPKLIKINPILYSSNIEDILKSFLSLNLSQHAFIVGHNPTLTSLAHRLCPTTKSIILPTAGVISLAFDTLTWDDLLIKQGKLLFFIEPKS